MATDLSQYVKLIQNPTSTPGVVNTTLWVDPNAPADVQAAVQQAREMNSVLGGLGGLSPQQQYDNVMRAYSTATNQPATLPGPTQAPVAAENQYPVDTPIPTDWSSLVKESTNSSIEQDNQPIAADGGGGLTVPGGLTPSTGGLPAGGVGPTWGNLVPTTTSTPTTTQPTSTTSSSPATNNTQTNTSGPSVAEQKWITQNQALAQQLFGTTTPPRGAVANYVNNWYKQQGTNAPAYDATDSAILTEFGYINPTSSTGTSSPSAGSFTQAPTPTGVSGNYAQVQNSLQSGAFATTGSSQQQQQQQSGGTSQQQTQGTSLTNQTNQQTQTGQTGQTATSQENQVSQDIARTQGTETTQAIDTLGFGQLLKDQAPGVVSSDAARSAWLQDVMNTGGTGFQSQMDQAVRNSLTGPQTTGAGDSARARMASYAAAETGRTNLNQRLAAAEQLSGPTGLATLSTAANPYIGKTTAIDSTTNTNRNTQSSGTTNTTGWSNLQSNGTSNSATQSLQNTTGSNTGWSNLTGTTNEAQSGITNAMSSQAGAGNIPEGQPVKTGGCVLCTAGIELGLWKQKRLLKSAIAYKLGPGWKKFRLAARGYFAVFGPFADFLLDHPKLAAVLAPLARMVVYEELRQAGRKLPLRKRAWLVHWAGDIFCRVVGLMPVCGYVKQQRILDIAKREGILFNVEA